MKPENRKILDDNRHFHETLIKADYLKGLNAREKEDLLRVMREEFNPGYYKDLWCPPCLADFIRDIYRYYDDWLKVNS